jgi:phage tail-like protein
MSHKSMAEYLYNRLPGIYRSEDTKNLNQLQRFLQVLAEGGFDKVLHDTEGLLSLIDINQIPEEYLPLMASDLGFEFPFDLDPQTQRTYIRNAIQSYKIKGTKKALEFMIRELTRFKTNIEIDKALRKIEVYLEVNLARQDFDRVVDKVRFIVDEYSPPYKILNLINTFLWEEDHFTVGRVETESMTVTPPMTDVTTGYEKDWFVTNLSLTNSSMVTPVGERYYGDSTVEQFLPETYTISEETDTLVPVFNEEDYYLTISFLEDEIASSNKDDVEIPFSINAPFVDYAYESVEWLGANNGLMNVTPTLQGETYTAEIDEEFDEMITLN